MSLPLYAKMPALWLFRIKPEVFAEDFGVIRELAAIECPEVFAMEIERFDGRNKRDRSFLRRWLGIRVSGQRLTRWKVKCFGEKIKKVIDPPRDRRRRRKRK